MVKFVHEKKKAVRFTLNMKESTVQEYAMNLLHIFNNAREYEYMIFKIENNSGSDVFVTGNLEKKDELKEYLEQFGDITYEEEINWFVIQAEYDSSGWKYLFGDDCECDFTVEVE